MTGEGIGRSTEELGALRSFRRELYTCFRGWCDALLECVDAMLCTPGPIASVPGLSLEPVFRRSHGSLYKALARGAIGATRHSAGQPIVAGWAYQFACQLSWAPNSWTAPVDVVRLTPETDATTVTIARVRHTVELLPSDAEVPLFVFDAGYDGVGLAAGLEDLRAEVLVRIGENRVFHPDPVGTLGWTTPKLRLPAQADRWTWLATAAYTELRLARGLVDDLRLPWERPCDPDKLTPDRVRRGFRRLRAHLGTPADPPKSTTPGPGRPKGTRKPPRTRYPAVKKAA